MLTLNTWPRICQPFPLYSYFFSLPPIRHFVGRSHYAQTTLKGWGKILHLPEVNYLNKSFGILLYGRLACWPHLFTHSSVYLYQYKLTGIYFQLWIILQYYIIHFVAQIVLSVVFQLAPVSIWYTTITVFFIRHCFSEMTRYIWEKRFGVLINLPFLLPKCLQDSDLPILCHCWILYMCSPLPTDAIFCLENVGQDV